MIEPRILLNGDSGGYDARIVFADHTKNRDNVWLRIQREGRPEADLNIVVTDEGIVLDLYQVQREDAEEADMEPVASIYAFDEDLTTTTAEEDE